MRVNPGNGLTRRGEGNAWTAGWWHCGGGWVAHATALHLGPKSTDLPLVPQNDMSHVVEGHGHVTGRLSSLECRPETVPKLLDWTLRFVTGGLFHFHSFGSWSGPATVHRQSKPRDGLGGSRLLFLERLRASPARSHKKPLRSFRQQETAQKLPTTRNRSEACNHKKPLRSLR